ncbi:aminoglycoside phosphotransferase family protein [Plastorhodobacter daqingensis]|uniref:Aminoglycoside phosphotransferase family protein n=1 Tax=Plastorhodobacter daqingensis TaxID=1387281 RepID=A0ABW2UGC5_9RHOB
MPDLPLSSAPPDRPMLSRRFLARTPWAAAQRAPLAGDASPRKYERLSLNGVSAVLMDADPATGEDVRPFVQIARHLSGLGLSAPAILAEDAENGFLLLEDLGDDLYARVLRDDPLPGPVLYAEATDVLAELQRHPTPAGLECYDAPLMADLAALALDWYGPAAGAAPANRTAFVELMTRTLGDHAPGCDGLILRDYHAENLIWLPGRSGLARVGLLDFQNAMRGHPAYDLISLTEDARRDVPRDLAQQMQLRLGRALGQPDADFARACAALAAQRNLRILGVFARLCLRDAKPQYVALIPRVWAHLQADLAHPALSRLRDEVQRLLPEPTPERLERIRGQCPRR